VKLDLAPLVFGVRCFGLADNQPLADFGNAEARTGKVLPQFG